ncbi:hypothetical protein ARMSODRAFT_685826 [Armillaria solidipes]|uniref:Uncharacterized protein n=1 Tax=Armillaria solidipes TaxID=1076256 RepID=A0A2H3BA22_9AGAR|nr:hypothetical protein ARMSODRAFT_685826 [Armillaria solidipes]
MMAARRKAGRCSQERFEYCSLFNSLLANRRRRWFRMWAITNGASRRSLATSCWVEVKEAFADPSETLQGNRISISTFDSVKLQPLMLALLLPQSVFFSDILPLQASASCIMPQCLRPQDINRTLLGSSPGCSNTCKCFLTTVSTEKTSLNIDIDFLGAGTRWGGSSRRDRQKQ